MAKIKANDLKNLAAQYAEVVAEEVKIKMQKEDIQARMKESMKAAGADKLETNFGAFTIYQRATWKYSPEIESEYEIIKQKEKQEQEEGIAKATYTESLRFTPIKKQSNG